MMRGLQKRLQKLERSMPRRQPEPTEEQKHLKYVKHLIGVAVANYLGDPRPNETLIAAHARALGYEHEGELIKAFKRKVAQLGDPELDKKYARARRRLFAKFGIKLNVPDRKQKMVDGFKRMEAGLSERFREQWIRLCRQDLFD